MMMTSSDTGELDPQCLEHWGIGSPRMAKAVREGIGVGVKLKWKYIGRKPDCPCITVASCMHIPCTSAMPLAALHQ